jgi:hypothetical protein
MSPDSVTRYGSFQARPDSDFLVAGTRTPITFIGYAEDAHVITGYDTIVNKGAAGYGEILFSSRMSNVVVTKDTARIIRWEGEHLFTVEQSIFTQGISGATIMVGGSGSGVSSQGFAFTSVISETLHDQLTCPWMRSGEISFELQEGDIRSGTIRFMGEESCTNLMYYNLGGNEYHLWLDDKYLSK